MKKCPNCQAELADDAVFCSGCGASVADVEPEKKVDAADHTAEFDEKDIADNKVIAILAYLGGLIGVLIALIVAPSSPFVAFQVRQVLKATVIMIALACIPFLGWIAICVLAVLMCINVVFICMGKAKEIMIINKIKFL